MENKKEEIDEAIALLFESGVMVEALHECFQSNSFRGGIYTNYHRSVEILEEKLYRAAGERK